MGTNVGVLLEALADPTRRAVWERLSAGPMTVGELAADLPVSRPAVSQHLNVLKEAGLVSERRNGTRRLYRARPEGLADLKVFLEGFWDERLDALKREAEKEERRKHGRND